LTQPKPSVVYRGSKHSHFWGSFLGDEGSKALYAVRAAYGLGGVDRPPRLCSARLRRRRPRLSAAAWLQLSQPLVVHCHDRLVELHELTPSCCRYCYCFVPDRAPTRSCTLTLAQQQRHYLIIDHRHSKT
jgi:hypothetical protein